MKALRKSFPGRLNPAQPDIVGSLGEMCIYSQAALQFFNEPLLFHELMMSENDRVFSSIYSNSNRILLCFS